jgi:hypothetical protein
MRRRGRWVAACAGVAGLTVAVTSAATGPSRASAASAEPRSGAATAPAAGFGTAAAATAPVWLCRPGAPADPCTSSLTTTVVAASGARSVQGASPDVRSPFDCFYVYPTVSREQTVNADLRVQRAEIDVAIAQASRFSTVCRVWAPIYRQVTLAGLLAELEGKGTVSSLETAYTSLASSFEAYLAADNHGRPIVFLGHSQGAAMLILLLERLVDGDPGLRNRLVIAIILGGNVEVPVGKTAGATFSHLPACTRPGETGCVIAYSSFPSEPPSTSLFGRPGTGVSLQSGQLGTRGLKVVCVNPAAPGGGSALLEPYFPSLGSVATPWVADPGLYRARCEQGGGASWLEVSKATGASDRRPTVSENLGPDWGYHDDDVNLALGNLVADVAAAEHTWSATHTPRH